MVTKVEWGAWSAGGVVIYAIKTFRKLEWGAITTCGYWSGMMW